MRACVVIVAEECSFICFRGVEVFARMCWEVKMGERSGPERGGGEPGTLFSGRSQTDTGLPWMGQGRQEARVEHFSLGLCGAWNTRSPAPGPVDRI